MNQQAKLLLADDMSAFLIFRDVDGQALLPITLTRGLPPPCKQTLNIVAYRLPKGIIYS